MTVQQAKEEIPNIDIFCSQCCDNCTANDWYCPSECDFLEKARKLDFDRIVKSFARNDGDFRKVCRYIMTTKLVLNNQSTK